MGNLSDVIGWSSYIFTSPDYYCGSGQVGVPSNFIGSQIPAHGNNYAGIIEYHAGDYREYLGRAITPLQIGLPYEASISVSMADGVNLASNGLGIFFYDNGPLTMPGNNLLSFAPQISYVNYGPITDKTNWTRLIATFVADSAYDNIIIGGFVPNASLNTTQTGPLFSNPYSYYYIDSVVVKVANTITLNYTDSLLCVGDTITVPFTTTGTFDANNEYILQLSDGSGSFSNPTNIGTVLNVNFGTIQGIIPFVTQSNNYKLRIVSTSPAKVSLNLPTVKIGNTLQKPVAGIAAPACTGQALNLTSNTNSPVLNWSWTGPNGFSALLQNPVIPNATVTANGNYIVTAHYYGCKSKDTIAVLVNPTPPPPQASSNSPVCLNNDILLTANSIFPSVSYSWIGPGFNSNQQNPVRVNAGMAMSGTYTVVAHANNCVSQPSSINVTIFAFPTSIMVYALPGDTVCLGEQVVFMAVATSAGPTPQYRWLKNGSIINGATTATFVTTNLANGDKISCVLVPDNSCPMPDTSDVIMTVLPSPPSSVSISAVPGTLVSPWQMITFNAVPTNGGNKPIFQWKRNGQDIIGANANTWSANNLANDDSINVIMTSDARCAVPKNAVSNKLVVNIKTNVDEIQIKSLDLGVYPNPNSGRFSINLSDISDKFDRNQYSGLIEVLNPLGQVVFLQKIQTKNLVFEISLPETISPGVYTCVVTFSDHTLIEKITVAK